MDAELEIIAKTGFSGYFLVVADICREARKRGIRYNTRGSAAGSLVLYALRVTNVDPVRYGIIFERMLNLDRPSSPDVDLDIDESRRGELIDYVTQKYGAEYVAQIATFGTIKSRAAIKDATRVLGLPYMLGESIVAGLPPVIMGKDTPLSSVMGDSPKREARYQGSRTQDEEVRERGRRCAWA
jgi:DNA polymerase-3 subunit alpha